MDGNNPISGLISGSNVTLTITQSLIGASQKVVYEGYFVGINALKGTVRVPGGGSWYAKRDPVHAQEMLDAAEEGNLEQVKALLKENSELVFVKDDGDTTPLHAAALRGHLEVVKLLLLCRAHVNARDIFGETALHKAAYAGSKAETEILLAHNAVVNAEDKKGRTPLKIATEQGNTEVAALLRQRGGHK